MSEAFPTLDEDIAAFEKKMSDDFDISIGQIKAAERALSDLRGMGFPSTHQSIYNLFTRLRSNERMARDAELAALKREAAALELLDAARKAIAKEESK